MPVRERSRTHRCGASGWRTTDRTSSAPGRPRRLLTLRHGRANGTSSTASRAPASAKVRRFKIGGDDAASLDADRAGISVRARPQ